MPPLYIYRNLRTGGFSVRQGGLVVDRISQGIARDVQFRVNSGGRARVQLEKQKHVHAFAVTRDLRPTDRLPTDLAEIKYNPYTCGVFMCNGEPIHQAKLVLFSGGRCYLLDEKSNSDI